MNNNQFRIEEIGLESSYLEAVIKLHAAGKQRLGPFPRGAFEEYAKAKMIIAALAPDNALAGYLLYRVAKDRAAIAHLMTAPAFRKAGVARLLVDSLKARTTHLLGISLRCRRDYNIDEMWRGLGFTVRHSKEGRGADGALLDYWWFDHNHDDLFSQAALRDQTSEAVLAAMDANVFYDITCDDRPQGEDTKVLQADWLRGSIVLCVTPEIYNEIHRAPTESDKKQRRMAAQTFHELKTDDLRVRGLEAELACIFNGATFERDISDMRQVAHAIAAEVPFFLTRDKPMLERSDVIFEKCGLRILHPTDLVNRFDMLRREAEYRPARLQGSSWRERLVIADDIGGIVCHFKHPTQQRTGPFEQQVRHFLANPNRWTCSVFADASKSPTILVVQSKSRSAHVEIPIMRHVEHPLAGTLLRHLAHEVTRDTAGAKKQIISVTDPHLSEESKEALRELGFLHDNNAWWKISITGIISRDELISQIRSAEIPASLKERLVGAIFVNPNTNDESACARLEKLFSPAKLISFPYPSYIISIRQTWAQHFFDIPVGGQTLMDLNERLHLGIEGAYYCSAQNTHVAAPGRVLWYVSGKGSMSIKACSHLEERIIGTPKELYARLRHLGVYQWKHVLESCNGKMENPLMAFRFARTERFARPVRLAELQRMGIPMPQNPRRITPEQFASIYNKGMNL